ncbi:MAG TPA: hypothetical protein VF640_06445, partial [Acidimicrobiales bacterium]
MARARTSTRSTSDWRSRRRARWAATFAAPGVSARAAATSVEENPRPVIIVTATASCLVRP